MNIWRINKRLGDAAFELAEKDARRVIRNLEGNSLIADWQMQKANIVKNTNSKYPLELAALFGGLNTFAANQEAVDIISQLVGEAIEWLPIESTAGTYYIANALNMLDCIDYANSEFTYWSNGAINQIRKLTLKSEVVAHHQVFLVKNLSHWLCISDKFKSLVEANGLIGAEFDPVTVH